MREHVLLFCLLGLVLTATILLMTAPGAVTWALAFLEAWISGLLGWVATAAVDCLSKGKSRSARQRAVLLLGREITQSCEKRIFVIAITARIPGRLLASCLFDRT